MPSSSSNSTFSGLLISHSIAPSTLVHRSFSSNGRFNVLGAKLGFMAGLLTNTACCWISRCRCSPKNESPSMFFVGWPAMSDGTPFIFTSSLNFLFCIPLAVCVNSFSSFSKGGDDARVFCTGSIRPENDPVGVGGVCMSSSSSSGDDRSTSGDGESSLRRSASASSDLEAALERAGDMIVRCAAYGFV
jgi:hypothetical protein